MRPEHADDPCAGIAVPQVRKQGEGEDHVADLVYVEYGDAPDAAILSRHLAGARFLPAPLPPQERTQALVDLFRRDARHG